MLRLQGRQCQERQWTEGDGTMSGIGTKSRFGRTENKSKFGGMTAIKYGRVFKQTKDKVWFVSNQSNAMMLTQFRKAMDAIALYVGKEFGELTGLMTAQA